MRRTGRAVFGKAAAVALAFAVASADAALANHLGMYIQNQSSETLYFLKQTGTDSYPNSIAPESTSDEIASPTVKNDNTHRGQISYMNAPASADATCTVTLGFQYDYDTSTTHCDDKSFTLSNTGACELRREQDCYGAGSCRCDFVFTAD